MLHMRSYTVIHIYAALWEHEPQGLRHRLGRVDLQIIWQKQVVLIYSG